MKPDNYPSAKPSVPQVHRIQFNRVSISEIHFTLIVLSSLYTFQFFEVQLTPTAMNEWEVYVSTISYVFLVFFSIMNALFVRTLILYKFMSDYWQAFTVFQVSHGKIFKASGESWVMTINNFYLGQIWRLNSFGHASKDLLSYRVTDLWSRNKFYSSQVLWGCHFVMVPTRSWKIPQDQKEPSRTSPVQFFFQSMSSVRFTVSFVSYPVG